MLYSNKRHPKKTPQRYEKKQMQQTKLAKLKRVILCNVQEMRNEEFAFLGKCWEQGGCQFAYDAPFRAPLFAEKKPARLLLNIPRLW
jgi:hypothetical protein